MKSSTKSYVLRHAYVAFTKPFCPSSRPRPNVNSRVVGDLMFLSAEMFAVGNEPPMIVL